MRSSPRNLRALHATFHRGFPPTPTSSLRSLPVSPRRYGLPFGVPTMAGSPPGHPGPRAAGSRPTTRIIRFEAFFPLQSSRCPPRRSPCRSNRALLGFRPSRAFSTRPLDPLAAPPRPRSAVRTAPRSLATPAATSGISRPPDRVNLVGRPVKDVRQTRRRFPVRCGLARATTSAAVLLPRPWTHAKATSRAT